MPLAKKLAPKYKITILDLPGFGASEEPTSGLTIYEYTSIIEEATQKLHLKNPILIGHSFGGRIAIIYASRNQVNKVVLFGAPCVRDRTPKASEKILKSLKKIPGTKTLVAIAKNYLGSTDYKNATPIMREILVNTINEDLSACAKKITAPTLLIWGTLDTAAPLDDAKKLEQLLANGGLVEIPNCTHYAYLEALDYVTTILKNFL
jgi:pimeloyl-ACP methyl ester carboxylesterase